MARSILVIGESGAGKTTSLRTLDPATTFIIASDKKGLNWRGWKKQYNTENKNYIATSDTDVILKVLDRIDNGDLQQFRTVVIDTLNAIMIDMELAQRRKNTYDEWRDLAFNVYAIVTKINSMRDDLTVICIGHSQTEQNDAGFLMTRMKTSGRKLDKICLESKFTTVLLARGNNGKYLFETRANNSTAKSPMGCFKDSELDNDMAAVITALDKYEEGEDE